MVIEIIEKTKIIRKYSGDYTRHYKTAKLSDIITFLKSIEHKGWMDKNGDKPCAVNKSLTNIQVHEIFLGASCEIDEYMDSLPFKNFKKAFGRKITWIQDVKCFKCGRRYRGVKTKYSFCQECIDYMDRGLED